jgi:hypothetical protein
MRMALIIAVAAAAAGMAWRAGRWIDWGFYAPERGVPAIGRAEPAAERRRGTVRVRLERHIAPSPAPLTLRRTAAFFGLEEKTFACSALETDRLPSLVRGLVAESLDRPRRVGDEVVLCLN